MDPTPLIEKLGCYALSCGLLLIPMFFWNALFASRLPRAFAASEFGRDIPLALRFIEDTSRLPVFSLPFFMPLEVSTRSQRLALLTFAVGTQVYFSSWLALISAPTSAWSLSALGFTAPGYTPMLWLLPLAFLGQRLYWCSLYQWLFYLLPATIFLAAHICHTVLAYARTHNTRL